MSHIEQQIFAFGKTIRIKATVEKKRDFEVEAEKEAKKTEDGKLEYPLYPHQNILGIDTIEFDDGVGTGEETWQPLEKNLDIGALIKERDALKKERDNLRMNNGRLKKRLQSFGVHTEGVEERRDA